MRHDFTFRIRPHVDKELMLAEQAYAKHRPDIAFTHLENAHVLGQQLTWLHVKVHCLMLRWGWRQHDVKEVLGQLLRIVGAASKTAFGLVPTGNTGGSNISPFKPLPLNAEHAVLIEQANTKGN